MSYFDEVQTLLRRHEPLGMQTLDNGTLLIGKVPHVGPRAYLHKIYAPLSDYEVEELAASIRMSIPEEYSAFLRLANGLNAFSDSFALYGFRRNYIRTGTAASQPYHLDILNVKERVPDSKESFFYVGSYSFDGSRLYIDRDTGKTFRCSRRSSVPLNEWPTFESMLQSEVERIAVLFDNAGKKRNPEVPTIPARVT